VKADGGDVLVFCSEDTRQQLRASEAESQARGLRAPSDVERARRRLAAAKLLLASADDGRRKLAIKVLRHMKAGRLL
jgi:hypothetical protein